MPKSSGVSSYESFDKNNLSWILAAKSLQQKLIQHTNPFVTQWTEYQILDLWVIY